LEVHIFNNVIVFLALAAFYQILREFTIETVSDFDIETARASLYFRSHNRRSTAADVSGVALHQSLMVR